MAMVKRMIEIIYGKIGEKKVQVGTFTISSLKSTRVEIDEGVFNDERFQTIEEVKKYHRDTLKLCVEKANQDEREILDEERRKKEREEKRISEHYDRINQLSEEIDFDW